MAPADLPPTEALDADLPASRVGGGEVEGAGLEQAGVAAGQLAHAGAYEDSEGAADGAAASEEEPQVSSALPCTLPPSA